MKTSPRLSLFLAPFALAATAGLSLLTGCAGFTGTAAGDPIVQQLHISGGVHGGQQPVSGAKVYLYTVSGLSGAASNDIVTTTNAYVTSDANGNFNITGDYTCPTYNTALSTYIVALGGNPGLASGTNNTAIALMAALGPCSGLNSSTFVTINEITTVAAVTALQQFMTDYTHIGGSTIAAQPSYGAIPGLANAMTTANSLVNVSTGLATGAPAAGSGIAPQATVNTLGNILASCINTLSASSTGCTALFTDVYTGTGGTKPTDTIGAMLAIAKNPGYNASLIYALGSSSPPFQPSLAAAPNDFSLGITYTGLNYPGQVIVDNVGDVFVANCPSCNGGTGNDSIQGFLPSGGAKLAATTVIKPTSIAIDRYNGIWVAEATNGTSGNQVTRIAYDTGAVMSGFPVALNGVPGGMALVENDNMPTSSDYSFLPASAWITDSTNGRLVLINVKGTTVAGLNTTGLTTPTAIAADGLENLYVIGTGSTNVVQYGPIYDRTQIYGTLTPATSLTPTTISGTSSGFSSPVSLALDGGDHLWTVDTGTKAVSELFAYNGTATSGSAGYTGINTANTVTIDGAGTAWIANCRKNCTGSGSTAVDNVVHLSAAGASLTTSDGLQNAAFAKPTGTAIDNSGNLWISNTSGASLTELVGVAVPVITELQTASSRHALPATNYLVNPSFELGSNTAVTGWTTSSTVSSCATPSEDTGSPFSGQQKLTFYCGSAYTATAAQTMTGLTNGNYLVSCYIAGAPGSTSQTPTITASGFGGTAMTTTATGFSYTFQPYSIVGVPVSNGTLTVTISNTDTYSGGGYGGFDSCSVTKQ